MPEAREAPGSRFLPEDAGAVSLAAYRTLSEVRETPGATVLVVPEAPAVPMLNRIVEPESVDALDAALATLSAGTSFYVSLEPDRERALSAGMKSRHLKPGWNWMRFARTTHAAPEVASALRFEQAETHRHIQVFASIVGQAFALPAALEKRLVTVSEAGWECWLAFDGDTAVAAGAWLAVERVGYLGLGATLPEHRGKGAQSALLALRVRRAGATGCDVVVTETGVLRDDRPSGSYRNILRAGFSELTPLVNWSGSTT